MKQHLKRQAAVAHGLALLCLLLLAPFFLSSADRSSLSLASITRPREVLRIAAASSLQQAPATPTVRDVLTRASPLVVLDHSKYFAWVAAAVSHTLSELGVSNTLSKGRLPADANGTYMIFTTHELHRVLPKHYVSYNFEQLTTDKPWREEFWQRLRTAEMVWDYSLENIKVMQAHNITNTYHVPLGYDETMEAAKTASVGGKAGTAAAVGGAAGTTAAAGGAGGAAGRLAVAAAQPAARPTAPPTTTAAAKTPPTTTQTKPAAAAPQRNLDVVFAGYINKRRAAKLAPLRGPIGPNNCTMRVHFDGAWGEELRALYRRSNIALNLHYYGGSTILEVHRILPIIIDKTLVLSEPSDDSWLDTVYSDLVNFTSAQSDLRQSVLSMLKLDVEQEAERRYQRLQQCCKYSRYFEQLLQQPYTPRVPTT